MNLGVYLSSWTNTLPILPNNMPNDSGITRNANDFSANFVKFYQIGYNGSDWTKMVLPFPNSMRMSLKSHIIRSNLG